jgi:hypothetical protein
VPTPTTSSPNPLQPIQPLLSPSLSLGRVVELSGSGEILVQSAHDPHQKLLCDFLETSDEPSLTLSVGDRVLYLPSSSLLEKGCVVGRVGAYREPDRDHVRIAANGSLKLTCGSASIEMRNDGKILTKGVDVVSLAKQSQRIKGGSVQIN